MSDQDQEQTSAQSPESEQPALPPYYCDVPQAYCPLCSSNIRDAYCKNPDCGRDMSESLLGRGEAFLRLSTFYDMFKKEYRRNVKAGPSDSSSNPQVGCEAGSSSNPQVCCEAGSSSNPQVGCENEQVGSSSIQEVHDRSDQVYSSNIRQSLHQTGRVYSSIIQNNHYRQRCIVCRDECTDSPHDRYPSNEFCSMNCWIFSRNPSAGPRPTSLPEGAYVDTCDCGRKFINRRSDSMDANYCSWECYGNR